MKPFPDLTAEQVEWLKEYFPLTVWDGFPASAPDYHRRAGVVELTQLLEAQLTDEHTAEDAQTALR